MVDKSALYTRDTTGLSFAKSERSNLHDELECVTVARFEDGAVVLRDSNDPAGGRELRFTAGEWAAFVGGIQDGQPDLICL